jgi:hypothetical protein
MSRIRKRGGASDQVLAWSALHSTSKEDVAERIAEIQSCEFNGEHPQSDSDDGLRRVSVQTQEFATDGAVTLAGS